MANDATHKLKVKVSLKWVQGNEYEASVAVETLDSCYHEVDLKIGLPPGTLGIPEIEYLTFTFTHSGGICSDIVKTVTRKINVPFSAAKRSVTAYAVVNGKIVGEDTAPLPKK
jgi:hypothetical protein